MKKKITAVILVVMMAVNLLVHVIAADDTIKVVFEGKQLVFDVAPVIENDRTLVPMRTIFEALGYTVEWDGENRSIKATSATDEINMHIDFYTFWVNGEAKQMDVAPTIKEGRTLVPLRAVSEASGCEVQWNEVARTIYIGRGSQHAESVMATAEPTASPTPKPTSPDFVMDITELKLKEGESETIETTVKARLADKRVVWDSSDHTIATVSRSGRVTGLEAGTCTITAKVEDVVAECQVTVTNVPKEPELEVKGYNTTKLFVDNRNYLTINIFNYGEYPVTIKGTGEYQYLAGAEGQATSVTKESKYDVYTQKLSCPETVIAPSTYQVLTFTRTKDEPKVGKKVLKEDFNEAFTFQFEYDGKDYTAKKIQVSTKDDDKVVNDFTY